VVWGGFDCVLLRCDTRHRLKMSETKNGREQTDVFSFRATKKILMFVVYTSSFMFGVTIVGNNSNIGLILYF